jgi:hypothetical protein
VDEVTEEQESGNRRLLVERAAKTWTGQLVDLGARNTLLYYRDLRQGTLDLGLAEVDQVALDQLTAGRAVRLSARAAAAPSPRRSPCRTGCR